MRLPATVPAPPPLRPGSTVAVVAPSSTVDRPDVRPRVEQGLELLRSWGLHVVEGAHLWGRHPDVPHLAGTDEERAADLLAAWRDPDVDAVLCARGGYGVQRLLDHLGAGALADGDPTWLVGFSDITPLLHRVVAEARVQALHGPAVSGLGDGDPASAGRVRDLLFGEHDGAPLLSGLTAWRDGEAVGPLVGGNVALLAASVGTGDLVDAGGAVVVLEDVGQPAFVLDRGLTQLVRSGWLDGAAGIVVGDFSMDSPAAEVEAVLRDRLLALGVPVWAGGTFGHERRNDPLPLGAEARLGAGELRLS